tara:strand:- start:148 stop:270 length:123 start_codon:yes stop_codon:yes gene_type:complete
MKNKLDEFLKDSAMWAIIFVALSLLIFYNYSQVKDIVLNP